MSCNYLPNEIDSMFDTEVNDINNDTMLSDKLIWNNDNLSITSNDVTWDTIYDDLSSHTFDQINDKNKDKYYDIDFHLTEFNDIFEEPAKTNIKIESTHTNSVSSSYLTDDGSPSSSNNNSPVGRKVKKRDFQTFDSSSEKSFALYDEGIEHHPLKAVKIESVSQPSRTIYKLSRDSKLEPREPIIIGTLQNQRPIVKIPRNNVATPYIVNGSIKSVNISKYSQDKFTENTNNNNNNNNNSAIRTSNNFQSNPQYDSPNIDNDCDLLNDNYYDEESDIYDNYKPRVGSFVSVLNSNSQHNTNSNSIFQTPRGNGSSALFQTPIPQSGPLYLTEEEKRTLLQENYPIPTRVPLTKQEERNLKKVRRKIKNKLSAQESRRKKKEYVDSLEKKVEVYEHEIKEGKRRIETLENQQRTLQNQIRHYQHQLMNKITGTGNTTSTGLMLFMVCFALIMVGNSFPSSYRAMNLPQSSLISRSSLYYMGYGPSRDAFNDSKQVLLQSANNRNQPDERINPSLEIDIIPRQSILLGEDNDERNFEDLIMSYRKPNKICDNANNYLIDSPIKSMKLMKNNSYQHINSHQDMIISRISNINLVK